VDPNGYPFVPVSIESYGRLGMPAMKVLHDLGNDAASPETHFSRAMFVAGALRELSGAAHDKCAMHQASTGFLAHVTGRSLRMGMGYNKEQQALSSKH
jgi:hypothetical protein